MLNGNSKKVLSFAERFLCSPEVVFAFVEKQLTLKMGDGNSCINKKLYIINKMNCDVANIYLLFLLPKRSRTSTRR